MHVRRLVFVSVLIATMLLSNAQSSDPACSVFTGSRWIDFSKAHDATSHAKTAFPMFGSQTGHTVWAFNLCARPTLQSCAVHVGCRSDSRCTPVSAYLGRFGSPESLLPCSYMYFDTVTAWTWNVTPPSTFAVFTNRRFGWVSVKVEVVCGSSDQLAPVSYNPWVLPKVLRLSWNQVCVMNENDTSSSVGPSSSTGASGSSNGASRSSSGETRNHWAERARNSTNLVWVLIGVAGGLLVGSSVASLLCCFLNRRQRPSDDVFSGDDDEAGERDDAQNVKQVPHPMDEDAVEMQEVEPHNDIISPTAVIPPQASNADDDNDDVMPADVAMPRRRDRETDNAHVEMTRSVDIVFDQRPEVDAALASPPSPSPRAQDRDGSDFGADKESSVEPPSEAGSSNLTASMTTEEEGCEAVDHSEHAR